MGKEGQLKSNNTTVVYVGARKLKKVEIESILPTYQDIFQRLNSLRKGVDIEHLNAGNAQVNNTFAILGGRGTGKTSVMYSIREELQAATGVSKESSNDIVLPILIPDNMKEESNIMGGIIGMLKDEMEKLLSKMENNYSIDEKNPAYFDSRCVFRRDNPLRSTFKNMSKQYCYLLPQYKDILSKQYSDLSEFVDRYSEKLGADSKFKETFDKFIRELLQAKKGKDESTPLLHIFLDDIDLNPLRAVEISKILLAYLAHPAIVVHLSGDLCTYEEALTYSFISGKNGNVVSGILSETLAGDVPYLKSKQRLAYEYLRKIMPPIYRYHLKVWSLEKRGEYFVGDSPSMMELLLKVFGEEKVGMLFCEDICIYEKKVSNKDLQKDRIEDKANKKKEEINKPFSLGYHIFDNTSRGLNNTYALLMENYDAGKETVTIANEANFKFRLLQTFVQRLVDSSVVLKQNDKNIENIILWGNSIETTKIRMDNYSSVVRDAILKAPSEWNGIRPILRRVDNSEEQMDTGITFDGITMGECLRLTNDTAVELFSIFEIIYFILAVTNWKVNVDKEAYKIAKNQALLILLSKPILDESAEQLDFDLAIMKNKRFRDCYFRSEFTVALHLYKQLVKKYGYRFQDVSNIFSQEQNIVIELMKVLGNKGDVVVKRWYEQMIDGDRKVLVDIIDCAYLAQKNLLWAEMFGGVLPRCKKDQQVKFYVDEKEQTGTFEEMLRLYSEDPIDCPSSASQPIKISLTFEQIMSVIHQLIINTVKNLILNEKVMESENERKTILKEILKNINFLNEERRNLFEVIIEKELWGKDTYKELIDKVREDIIVEVRKLYDKMCFCLLRKNVLIPKDKILDCVKMPIEMYGEKSIAIKTVRKINERLNVTENFIAWSDYYAIYVWLYAMEINNRLWYGQMDAQDARKRLLNLCLTISNTGINDTGMDTIESDSTDVQTENIITKKRKKQTEGVIEEESFADQIKLYTLLYLDAKVNEFNINDLQRTMRSIERVTEKIHEHESNSEKNLFKQLEELLGKDLSTAELIELLGE